MSVLSVSALGILHMVASSQRWVLLTASCPMPATPWIWVLTRVLTAEIAMKPANATTTTRRAKPATSLFGAVPSPPNPSPRQCLKHNKCRDRHAEDGPYVKGVHHAQADGKAREGDSDPAPGGGF